MKILQLTLLSLTFALGCSGKSEQDSASDTTNTTDKTETEDTQSTAIHGDCVDHDDCQSGYFCSIECFVAPCGDDESVSMGTLGEYCQPCDECQEETDSVTGDCSVCE